jgi:hypothetical protein
MIANKRIPRAKSKDKHDRDPRDKFREHVAQWTDHAVLAFTVITRIRH